MASVLRFVLLSLFISCLHCLPFAAVLFRGYCQCLPPEIQGVPTLDQLLIMAFSFSHSSEVYAIVSILTCHVRKVAVMHLFPHGQILVFDFQGC